MRILREANVWDNRNKKLVPETNDKFFVKDTWEENNLYTDFIRNKIKEIGLEIKDCNISYMNLNKRGGFGKVNHSRLKHYVEKYKRFIEKEIEIIDPDVIICGGTFGHVWNLRFIAPRECERPEIINFSHPRNKKN